MMSIDRKAIDDMANLMSLLEGKSDQVTPIDTPVHAPQTSIDPATADMQAILNKLNEAQNGTYQKIVERAEVDTEFRMALETERTERGARIGSWEIIVHDGDAKSFDVVHTHTNDVIAKDLTLYEAAFGITKGLNEGLSITNPRIREFLRLEDEFVRHRTDAVQHKTVRDKMIEKGDFNRAGILEARFEQSQEHAINLHDRILKLAGLH
jgi:hypothetical protein